MNHRGASGSGEWEALAQGRGKFLVQQRAEPLLGAMVRDERQRLLQALRQYSALTAFDSQANFVTIRVPDAAELFAFLKKNGILIKNLHGSHPLLDQCLRLTCCECVHKCDICHLPACNLHIHQSPDRWWICTNCETEAERIAEAIQCLDRLEKVSDVLALARTP